MAINFTAIFARKHGAAKGYPVIASFDGEHAVLRAFAEIIDPVKGADFRAEHAEVQLIRGVRPVDHLDFPDPSITERARLKALQADALAKQEAARKAAASHKAAQALAKSAAVAYQNLSPEQKQFLADLDAAEAKAEKEAAAAQAKAEAAEKEAAARRAAAEKAQAEAAAKTASEATAALAAAVPPKSAAAAPAASQEQGTSNQEPGVIQPPTPPLPA